MDWITKIKETVLSDSDFDALMKLDEVLNDGYIATRKKIIVEDYEDDFIF